MPQKPDATEAIFGDRFASAMRQDQKYKASVKQLMLGHTHSHAFVFGWASNALLVVERVRYAYRRKPMWEREVRNILKVALSLSLAFVVTTALGQATPIVRISGSIEKVDGNILSIKSSDGQTLTLKLDDNYSIAVVTKASLADIKPNSYIGTAAVPMPDGRVRALEVHIFSEELRGMSEGSHATDLQPGSTMTNAAVAGNIEATDGRILTLTYKGGEKKVFVPPNAPIVWYEPGTKEDVKLGAGIKVRAEKLLDGTFKANSITLGRNGFNPPN